MFAHTHSPASIRDLDASSASTNSCESPTISTPHAHCQDWKPHQELGKTFQSLLLTPFPPNIFIQHLYSPQRSDQIFNPTTMVDTPTARALRANRRSSNFQSNVQNSEDPASSLSTPAPTSSTSTPVTATRNLRLTASRIASLTTETQQNDSSQTSHFTTPATNASASSKKSKGASVKKNEKSTPASTSGESKMQSEVSKDKDAARSDTPASKNKDSGAKPATPAPYEGGRRASSRLALLASVAATPQSGAEEEEVTPSSAAAGSSASHEEGAPSVPASSATKKTSAARIKDTKTLRSSPRIAELSRSAVDQPAVATPTAVVTTPTAALAVSSSAASTPAPSSARVTRNKSATALPSTTTPAANAHDGKNKKDASDNDAQASAPPRSTRSKTTSAAAAAPMASTPTTAVVETQMKKKKKKPHQMKEKATASPPSSPKHTPGAPIAWPAPQFKHNDLHKWIVISEALDFASVVGVYGKDEGWPVLPRKEAFLDAFVRDELMGGLRSLRGMAGSAADVRERLAGVVEVLKAEMLGSAVVGDDKGGKKGEDGIVDEDNEGDVMMPGALNTAGEEGGSGGTATHTSGDAGEGDTESQSEEEAGSILGTFGG